MNVQSRYASLASTLPGEGCAMTPVPIAGIDHVALVVRDIDDALPWFTDQLGFTLIGDERSPAAGGVRLVYFDAGNITIQLVSPTGDSGPIAEHLAVHGD